MKARRSEEYNKIIKRLQTDDEGYMLGIWLDEKLKMNDFLSKQQTKEIEETEMKICTNCANVYVDNWDFGSICDKCKSKQWRL